MSYKRIKIIKALKEYGFEFMREGHNHTIFTNGKDKYPSRETQRNFPKNNTENSERDWCVVAGV